MSSSRSRTVEDIYESQNDQRLDELHSKIRTLRGITTDIHDDVEAQNLLLDNTNDRFSSFGTALSQTSQRAAQAFGIGTGSLKPWRIAALIVGVFIAFWLTSKVLGWWWGSPATASV
ncbi:Bet1-like protein [Laccaria bicolor S238N-H82]|uniref:Bet1-like protein n=1 Tax=Laccaria bicolor (strain S238N-H82 / ATCC MYA-4686) TaxID=486041 RepID=B0D5Z2_LACBS|nr:Bet1-like protein [Laccaria bicolor S238N-H82]EDR09852.1 Bet1-like protein [Laccaria bicolor S238N-H82]|eukprot:XP_001879237.1 Bet1-like protein [Laccaria bicolor S238N-H82]